MFEMEAWRDGTAVKRTYCSCKRPKLESQSCESSSRGSDAFYWPPLALHSHAHTHTQRHALTKNKNLWTADILSLLLRGFASIFKKAINVWGWSSIYWRILGVYVNCASWSYLSQKGRKLGVFIHQSHQPIAEACSQEGSALLVCLWK